MDTLTKKQRSCCMAKIRSKDTAPELKVRRLIHKLGFRFRLHRSDLPGCPDIVMPRHKKIILIHGCFWHMHNCQFGIVKPKTNRTYWEKKREGNERRDTRNINMLKDMDWQILVIWECWTKNIMALEHRIFPFLNESN